MPLSTGYELAGGDFRLNPFSPLCVMICGSGREDFRQQKCNVRAAVRVCNTLVFCRLKSEVP